MPLILIAEPPHPADAHVRLPVQRENIFGRLIRDPTAPNRPAREWLCTEMLCGILINAPSIRAAVIDLLASRLPIASANIAELQWRFATEQSIGSKRDDLRIEGFRLTADGEERIVLWSVEAKVAAGLHESRSQILDNTGEPLPHMEPIEVSQLVNYDRWLSMETAKHRAGFVLAVTDYAEHLPSDLSQPWRTLTWTDLALAVEQQLAEDALPAAEQLLAEHMVGFIRSYLWNEEDMSNNRFEFNDLALLRAFVTMGAACFRKTDSLVTSLEEVILESSLPIITTGQTKRLPSRSTRTFIYGKFLQEVRGGPLSPTINAGIVGGNAQVWLESSPPSPAKSVIRSIVRRHSSEIHEQNSDWDTPESPSDWVDLQLTKPLDRLLVANDQEAALKQFVVDAIADLKSAGIADDLNTAIEQLRDDT